jgi:hypothetical protein
MIQRVVSFLSSLPGVVDVAECRREQIPELLNAEEANLTGQLVPVRIPGMQTVAQREMIAVMLKDSSFRRPPSPTIYLVEEAELQVALSGELITAAGTSYHIIGEEVMDKEPVYAEKHMFFDKGFVLFPERREKRQHVPSFFILPSISFPELEVRKKSYGMCNIVSVSPSTRGDEYLRSLHNFSKNPEYATILIGWDRATPRTERIID